MDKKDVYVIDFTQCGNVIRLYYGNDPEYWGDDWNDRPYEHNAGTVYQKYVKEIVDYGFDLDTLVLSPEFDWHYYGNSPYCKEDFKERKAPCLVILPRPDDSFFDPSYSDVIGDDSGNIVKIYYGDSMEETDRKISRLFGKCLSDKEIGV